MSQKPPPPPLPPACERRPEEKPRLAALILQPASAGARRQLDTGAEECCIFSGPAHRIRSGCRRDQNHHNDAVERCSGELLHSPAGAFGCCALYVDECGECTAGCASRIIQPPSVCLAVHCRQHLSRLKGAHKRITKLEDLALELRKGQGTVNSGDVQHDDRRAPSAAADAASWRRTTGGSLISPIDGGPVAIQPHPMRLLELLAQKSTASAAEALGCARSSCSLCSRLSKTTFMSLRRDGTSDQLSEKRWTNHLPNIKVSVRLSAKSDKKMRLPNQLKQLRFLRDI